MATVVKNFRIKSGLVVEGTTGTIGGQNILTETGGDAYILNLVGGATLVKSVDTSVFNVDGSGNLTIVTNTFDSFGSASAAQSAAATDATNKAASAQSAAQAFATSADTALYGTVTSDIATAKSEAISAAATDATTKAGDASVYAINAAQSIIDGAISTEVSNRNSAIATAKSAAEATASADATSKANAALASAQTYTDTAVAGLVDSAPELLNTLNELALALGDSPDTISNLTTLVGTKADTSYVNSEISDLDTAAQGYASDAQAAAEATASSDATSKANAAQAAAEATAAAANAAQQAGTTAFTALNINDEAKQIAATSASLGSVVVTAYQWAKADYRSGKFLVKIDNGTDNEISEILVTLDSSDNVAITEYAIVGTNGSRGTVTATVSGANVQLRVDPVNDSTIKVSGTLLK